MAVFFLEVLLCAVKAFFTVCFMLHASAQANKHDQRGGARKSGTSAARARVHAYMHMLINSHTNALCVYFFTCCPVSRCANASYVPDHAHALRARVHTLSITSTGSTRPPPFTTKGVPPHAHMQMRTCTRAQASARPRAHAHPHARLQPYLHLHTALAHIHANASHAVAPFTAGICTPVHMYICPPHAHIRECTRTRTAIPWYRAKPLTGCPLSHYFLPLTILALLWSPESEMHTFINV